MGAGGGGGAKEGKQNLICDCGTVCRSESLMQFLRHGRIECDGCKKEEKGDNQQQPKDQNREGR